MQKFLSSLAAAAALLVPASPALAEETFRANLSGANEVPAVATGTAGRFRISLNKDLTEGEYRLTVRDGVRVTQAHLHCGPAGINGPVVVFLAGFHPAGWDVHGTWIRHARITDANIVNITCGTTLAEVVEAVREGLVYVNVHTVAKPGGEIRGQLSGGGREVDE